MIGRPRLALGSCADNGGVNALGSDDPAKQLAAVRMLEAYNDLPEAVAVAALQLGCERELADDEYRAADVDQRLTAGQIDFALDIGPGGEPAGGSLSLSAPT